MCIYFCHIFGISIESGEISIRNDPVDENFFIVTAFLFLRLSLAARLLGFDSCSMIFRRSHNRRVLRRSHMAVTVRTHYGDHNCRHRIPGNSSRKTDVGDHRMDYRTVVDCRNNSMSGHSARTYAVHPGGMISTSLLSNDQYENCRKIIE